MEKLPKKYEFIGRRAVMSCVNEFPSKKMDFNMRTSSNVVRISSIHQLASFNVANDGKLVHVSQQDFWALKEDDDGFYIERLVDDRNGPVGFL